MDLSQEAVDSLAENLYRIHGDLVRLEGALQKRQMERAQELALESRLFLQQTLLTLQSSGAKVENLEQLARDYKVPANLLSSSANRRLAQALEVAYGVADEVDQERGHPPNSWVGLLFEILLRVEREVETRSASSQEV